MSSLTVALTKSAIFISMSAIYGCAGTNVSKFVYNNETYKVNVPIKEDKCYDASVLLGVNVTRAKDIANKVIFALDTTVEKKTDSSIMALKNRHSGAFGGSGGEELTVNFKMIDSNNTFVTATTKTGFVGGGGQKAWSCEIIDQMIEMALK